MTAKIRLNLKMKFGRRLSKAAVNDLGDGAAISRPSFGEQSQIPSEYCI